MSVNTQTVGLKRNTIDKYYTHPSVVTKCVQQIKQHIKMNSEDEQDLRLQEESNIEEKRI